MRLEDPSNGHMTQSIVNSLAPCPFNGKRREGNPDRFYYNAFASAVPIRGIASSLVDMEAMVSVM